MDRQKVATPSRHLMLVMRMPLALLMQPLPDSPHMEISQLYHHLSTGPPGQGSGGDLCGEGDRLLNGNVPGTVSNII